MQNEIVCKVCSPLQKSFGLLLIRKLLGGRCLVGESEVDVRAKMPIFAISDAVRLRYRVLGHDIQLLLPILQVKRETFSISAPEACL